ncbi:hypothetical protein BDN70DRAFT_931580 [Pholiota conissans]|uniref:Fungal N-terminal domain-containing protein n=1 Tax=Pholiota conissans TaxID=109636 RepID=A0A9P5Z6Y0_9AGAR|nr:hypothetical protein BDN70DRAFT_931580 [Pholiota conissans]
MDPISISLAAIALATALKDIVETANAIQDAFSKYPQSYKSAQKLAKSILVTVEQLKEIYEEKKAVIDGKSSLKRALDDLHGEMKHVYEECMRLLPPVSIRKRDKFKIAFYSFWRRKEVERSITGLNEDVIECISRFNTLATVRTETHVVEIYESLVSNARIEARVEGIHRDITWNSHTYDQGIGHRSATPAHLFTFAGSSSMPMTWIPDSIPTHKLSKAYLRREIGRIDMSILLDPVLRWLQSSPDDLDLPSFSWQLGMPVESDVTLHQDAVISAFRIQSLLKKSPSNDVLLYIVCTTSYLVDRLQQLEMFEDALLIESMVNCFWRDLTRQFQSQSFSIHHAESLTNLAISFSDTGNQLRVQSTAEEAIIISQSLMQIEPDAKLRTRYNVLLARNMIMYARWESDSGGALQLVTRAGYQLWKAFGSDQLSVMDISHLSPGNWMTLGFTKLFQHDITDEDYFTCASCLLDIAAVQLNHCNGIQSNSSAKLSLEIVNYLLHKFPDSEQIQDLTRSVLAHLSKPAIRSLNSLCENREYTQQNTALLRKLVQLRPQKYAISLAYALRSEWEILMDLRKSEEAEIVYQEMSSLGHLVATPPHLSMNIPSKIEGDYFLMVAHSHYRIRRFADAITASRNAIAQYSALEFINPECSREHHICTLVLLCESLNATGQYEAAILEGLKAFNIIDQYIPVSKLEKVQSHQENILYEILRALRAWSDTKAVAYAKTVNIIDRLRRIFSSRNVESPWISMDDAGIYVQQIRERGWIKEAVRYFQELRPNWRQIFGPLDTTTLAPGYRFCLNEISKLLGDIGYTDTKRTQ